MYHNQVIAKVDQVAGIFRDQMPISNHSDLFTEEELWAPKTNFFIKYDEEETSDPKKRKIKARPILAM